MKRKNRFYSSSLFFSHGFSSVCMDPLDPSFSSLVRTEWEPERESAFTSFSLIDWQTQGVKHTDCTMCGSITFWWLHSRSLSLISGDEKRRVERERGFRNDTSREQRKEKNEERREYLFVTNSFSSKLPARDSEEESQREMIEVTFRGHSVTKEQETEPLFLSVHTLLPFHFELRPRFSLCLSDSFSLG